MDVFQPYEVEVVKDAMQPRSVDQATSGLPRDLHLALLAAMMFSDMSGQALHQQG
jgi:hypothetical protein